MVGWVLPCRCVLSLWYKSHSGHISDSKNKCILSRNLRTKCLTHSVQPSPSFFLFFSFLMAWLSLGPSSDWQEGKLLPQNFSVGGDNLQQSEGIFFSSFSLLFFFFPPPTLFLLMPHLNGNSLSRILRGCAEHAVVMIDKKEWGHGGRQCAPIVTPPSAVSEQKARGSRSTHAFFDLFKKKNIKREPLRTAWLWEFVTRWVFLKPMPSSSNGGFQPKALF